MVRIGAAEDGRKRVVSLTAGGGKRVNEARDAWPQAQAQFEHALGSEAAKSLRAAMSGAVKSILETGAA